MLEYAYAARAVRIHQIIERQTSFQENGLSLQGKVILKGRLNITLANEVATSTFEYHY